MNNIKTTLSGAFAATGIFIAGAPVAFAVFGSDFIPTSWARVFVVVGFAMQGIGVFCGHLFSADGSTVKQLKTDVKQIQTGTEMFKNENKTPPDSP